MNTKRTICLALAAAMLLLSLAGCGNLSEPKLVSVPDDITINSAELSETLQFDATLYGSSEFPLVASIPSDGVFIYDVNQSGKYGVLVKYNNIIQYFAWTYFKGTSQPEVSINDYDGDGEKEIAISLLTNKGETNYNETLYLLEYKKRTLDFVTYSDINMFTDAANIVNFSPSVKDKQYSLTDGKNFYTLDFSGKGSSFQGLYLNAYCNFHLGETITSTVKIRYIFDNIPTPEESDYSLLSTLSYDGQSCRVAESHIVVE